jgi:hypothetical protein
MHDPTENKAEELHTHEHEHTDTHTHEHTHPHGEEHEHRHGHEHGHDHPHEHHHDHGEARPLDQLYALMRYMTGHNADHTRELETLAGQLKNAGNEEAYALTMEAVRFFDQGNAVLSKALEKLSR